MTTCSSWPKPIQAEVNGPRSWGFVRAMTIRIPAGVNAQRRGSLASSSGNSPTIVRTALNTKPTDRSDAVFAFAERYRFSCICLGMFNDIFGLRTSHLRKTAGQARLYDW